MRSEQNQTINSALTNAMREIFGSAPIDASSVVQEYLDKAGFAIVPKVEAGSAARISKARRTGDWTGVCDRDWNAWVGALRKADPAAAASIPLTYAEARSIMSAGYKSHPRGQEAFEIMVGRMHGLLLASDGTVTVLDQKALDAGVIGIVERKLEPRAGAVRDLVDAHRLIAEAREVLGADAL